MAWSYGLCCGNLSDADLENRWRYLWYFVDTLSLASTFVTGALLSTNVWAIVYDVAILVALFFQCASMGIVCVSLSSSRKWVSSLSKICPSMWPICLVLVCCVVLISTVSFVLELHVSEHCDCVICPFFQLMFGLCCCNHVRPMTVLLLPLFVMVNRVCSQFQECVTVDCASLP